MAPWLKRTKEDYTIDFDTLEELIGDLLDSLETKDVDLTKPIKVSFDISLDLHGCVKINEYGLVNDKQVVKQKKIDPLVEMIDFEHEIMAAVELSGIAKKDFDVKIFEKEVLIMGKTPRKVIRRLELPCKVIKDSLRTEFKNSVLEISLKKKPAEINQSVKK